MIKLISFGLKYNLNQAEFDLTLDARALKNPHNEVELRALTGLDDRCIRYVQSTPQFELIIKRMYDEIMKLQEPAKVGIYCTGGKHRSVVATEALACILRGMNYDVIVEHRTINHK